MKRIIALLLVLSFVLLTLMACTGDENETEAPINEDDTLENNGHTLDITNDNGDRELIMTINPDDHDYDGENIVMLIRNDEKIIREFGSSSSTEEINEPILTRNEQVATDLNLYLIPEYIGSDNAGVCSEVFTKRITDDVNTGMHTVDLAAHFAYYAGNVEVRERSANLLDEDLFPYFDFSLPCWNQAIAKSSTVNGVSLVCAGDMTLSLFNFAYVLWHNKTLYEKVRDKQKDPKDIQDIVLTGDWTSDKLYKWSSFYENTSATDDCDTYGLQMAWNRSVYVDICPYAWNFELMLENPDGTHSYNVVGNEKAEEAVVLFRKMRTAQGNGADHNCNTGNCFIAGNVVFREGVISYTAQETEQLRSMEDLYALIPFPKFDELQVGRTLTELEKKLGVEDMGYYTTTQDCYSLISVLDHSESSIGTKGEEISAYLQYSTELSYKDVRGYYFEKIIRGKNFGLNDEDGTVTKSIRIFNMIVNNIQFEFWTLYSASLNNITHLFRNTTLNGTGTVESGFETDEARYMEALNSTDVWFGLIEEE